VTSSDHTTASGRRLAFAVLTALSLLLSSGSAAAFSGPAADAGAAALDPADESQDFRFPGADMIAMRDGSNQYITYGASAHGRKVPFSISGSGATIETSPTIDGDAMANGLGDWAMPDSSVWTPGVHYHVKDGVGRYYLFYTASKKNDNERKCIGVARSRDPRGPFFPEPNPLVCPDFRDRWALDADITVGPNDGVWMTWRDGQRRIGNEATLSVMLLKFQDNGTVDRATDPVVILRSDNLAWPRFRDNEGVITIENPVALYHNNSWYLFYSGNNWDTNYYATGIAFCGAKIDDGPCSPMPGPNRAYFSYSGPEAHLPDDMRVRGLPGNKRGPGSFDIVTARDGRLWAIWNYLCDDSPGRKSRVGRLAISGSGNDAVFSVHLP
jgi:Glycosyl hydrolases family 43